MPDAALLIACAHNVLMKQPVADAVGDFGDADEGFAELQYSKTINRVGKVRTEATKRPSAIN